METLLRTLRGEMTAITGTEIESLSAGLSGDLLYPDDERYADATLIWNALITKRPALVVQPADSGDLVRVIGFARDHGLEISIKGGGHNIAGLALSDQGITIDMSRFKGIAVDTDRLTVRVGSGCTLGEVDRATQEHGLATALGFVSETGVAGLTLGGGFGYLTRQLGWTVDNLLDVEIVTADGQILRCSRDQEADLFWALRGGGANFGVVTEFTYRVHRVGPEITGGIIAWSADDAEQVLEMYRDVTDSAPREMTTVVLLRNAPPAPWLPEDKHSRPMIAVVVVHTGDPEQADSDIKPIRECATPWVDLIQRKRYAEQQSMLDATQPKGMQYYWKSEFLPGLSDGLLHTIREKLQGVEAPANQLVIFHLAGAIGEHAEDDGSVGNRDAAFVCAAASLTPPGSDALAANQTWVRDVWSALRPFSTGGNYINFQTEDEAATRTSESYRGNMARLQEVKSRYDPGNLFRVNRNIAPG